MYIFTCTCICAYIYPHTHVAAYTAKTPDAVGPARVARDPGASFECAGQPFQSLYQYEVLN